MKNEKQDLRIIKTKKVLYMALVDLMREKTFEEIKVSEICARALVNRSTFYAHYEDKYEFLVDFLDTFKDSLTSYLDTNNNNLNTKEYYMEMLKLLLTHIEDKKNIYSAIMVNNRNGVMMDIISDVVNKDIKKRVQESGLNKKTLDFLINYKSRNLIYMSCNPFTLARDLSILKDIYEVNDVYYLDMFPKTKHMECLCVLKLK